MDRPRLLARTAKTIANLLGRQPDTLGLLPDEEGFVAIRALLAALAEDPELRRVRRIELQEICTSLDAPPLEIVDERIRATQRARLEPQPLSAAVPKLLFAAIRPRAHMAVLENGLRPTTHPQSLLAESAEVALRWGRRLTPEPVLVTVRVREALTQGVHIARLGTMLYLAGPLPPSCLTLPPLPKQAPPPSESGHTKPPPAGSFILTWPPARGSHPGRPIGTEKPATGSPGRDKRRKPRRDRTPPPWRS